MQDEDAVAGNRVSSYLVDLPVGEPNPRVRLTRLSYAMRGIAQHGQSVGADSLIALTGFAPPTLHALGARAARGLSRRLFNLVVTNVPGPQFPLYAAGSRMLEVFPVVPLARGQGLSIGMTSYDGRVFFGLNADRDSVGDVDVLADLIEQEVGRAGGDRRLIAPAGLPSPFIDEGNEPRARLPACHDERAADTRGRGGPAGTAHGVRGHAAAA